MSASIAANFVAERDKSKDPRQHKHRSTGKSLGETLTTNQRGLQDPHATCASTVVHRNQRSRPPNKLGSRSSRGQDRQQHNTTHAETCYPEYMLQEEGHALKNVACNIDTKTTYMLLATKRREACRRCVKHI